MLRDLIDHITSGFGDQVDVTQKDVLDEDIRKQYPQYASLPDDQLAAAAAKHAPDQYGYLSTFDPVAKVEPAKVPKTLRTEQFYQRNPDVATQEAKDTLTAIRKQMPAYADVSDQELAGAAEQNNPGQYGGLVTKLNAGEIEKARSAARDKVFAVANDVSKSLQAALSNTAAVPEVTAIREGFNKIIAPKIDQIKKDTVDYWAPSEDEIVKHTQDTGSIPYAKIAKRTAISTAVAQLPSKIEDFGSMFVIPEAAKVIGATFPFLGKTLGELFPKTHIPEVMPEGSVPRGTSPEPNVNFSAPEQAALPPGPEQGQIAGRSQAAIAEGPAKTAPALPSGGVQGPGFRMADHPDVAAFQEYLSYSPKTGESITRTGYRTPEVTTPAGVEGAKVGPPMPSAPPIERTPHKLTPEQTAVESDAIKALQDNYPQFVQDYRKRFGKTLNVDDARKLFPAYEATPQSRSINAPAVHEPASALTKGIYEQMLQEKDPTGNNNVLFMAGGGGSGKTSFLRHNAQMQDMLDSAQIVVDGTLANPRSAAARIDSALGAGKNVHIVTVYRPPEAALNHVLERAQATGRTVHLGAFADAHQNYPGSVRTLMERYKDNPNVNFYFADNQGGPHEVKPATVDVLNKAGYTGIEPLRSIVDEAYRTGKISAEVYRGTTGEEPPVGGEIPASGSQELKALNSSGPAAAPASTPSEITPRVYAGEMKVPVGVRASAASERPPTDRWTNDAGATPGEPVLYLDAPNGAIKKSRAAVVLREDARQNPFYTVNDSAGKQYGGKFAEPEEAAKYAESVFPPSAAPSAKPKVYETSGNALDVPVSDLHTSPERFQPRKELIQSRVQSLANDMQDKGFKPSKPIIAWKDPQDGHLYVLAGHHRLAAAQRAGLDTVPTVVETGSEADAIAMARRSNSTRAPMSAIEEAKAYQAEADHGATYAEISRNYGGAKVSEIQRKMALNHLSPSLQDMVDSSQFSVNHAIELGSAVEKYGLSPTVQQQIFNEVVKKMDVTPATFRTMLDTLGPAAAKQIDMGFDFKIDQGILTPLRELATKTATLDKARRQLSGYVKYIDTATSGGEKISTAQLTARNQAARAVVTLEKEIAQLKRSVGAAAKPSVNIKKVAESTPAFDQLFPEPASAEAGAVKLGPDSPNMDLGNGKMATFKREMYDRFEPIKYKEGAAIAPDIPQAGGNYTESYVAARELKGKIRARGQELLTELNDVVKPLENNADRQVLNKIYSLRNFAELDRLGKTTSGVTEQAANDLLAKLEKEVGPDRFNRISKVADQVADLQNNKALDVLVEGKVITAETAQTLRERYPHYLRSEILDAQLAKEYPEFQSGTNGEPLGRINKSFLKTKEGTKKLINTDVLDVVRRSLVTKVAAAEKQQVIDQIVHEFGTEIGNQVVRDGAIVTKVNPTKIPPGFVKSSVKASDNKIYAVRKDIEELLRGMNRQQMDMITSSMGAFNRIFKTGATTYRAPFVLSNLFRDAQELLFKARSVPGQANKVVSYTRALISSVKEAVGMSDANYEAWARGGGSYGGIVTSVPDGVRIPFRLLEPKQQMTEAIKRGLMIPFKMVSIPAEILENTSRLAEYLRLKPTALPESLKILNSRDITVDFEKMGDAMKVYNTWIPFLNPGVQGAVNIGRAFKEQPLVSMGKLAAYIGVPTVALYAWNRKFSNDDQIDPYIKDNFWYVNSGQTTIKDGRKVPIIFTIRKGETAQFFSYPIQNLLEFGSHDKNFMQHLQDWSPSGMARGAASWLTPPAYKEPLEQAANYDFFRQGPIIPKRLEDVRPGFQFTRGTTNSARKAGETLNLSPLRLEHAAYGIWPASRQVLQLMDLVFNPKPTFPMKPKDALERSRDFQPIVRTPSGYFTQDEAAARQFNQQYKEDRRTPAFLFKEAMSRYAESRDPQDLATVKTFARQISDSSRQRIVAQIQKDLALNSLSADRRALARMNPAERRAYARQLQTENK